jgi:hypothetical protein
VARPQGAGDGRKGSEEEGAQEMTVSHAKRVCATLHDQEIHL